LSKKDEFVKAFKKANNGVHPKKMHEQKLYSEFAEILNSKPHLKILFYEAWDEESGKDTDPAAGLGQLFDLNK